MCTIKRMDPVVIGVDSSTQSTKAAVVDAATGRLLAVGRAAHTVSGQGGARESDPEQWWTALAGAVAAGLAESGARPASVAGIAVAGQQHGLVALDTAGRPLRPAMLWNDTRAAPQAAALTEELGGSRAWLERTGSVPVASMTAAKWRWLREHEPRTAEAAAAVRLPHDFLTERLAGTAATDPGDASGTCWYSTATGAYDSGLLDLLGLDASLLPQVAPTGAARVGPDRRGGGGAGTARRRRRGGRDRRQHGGGRRTRARRVRAAGPPGGVPRHLRHRVRGDPHPARRRRARRVRRHRPPRHVPAARLHPQLHAGGRQGGRPARPRPGRRAAGRRDRPAAVPGRGAHPRPAGRGRAAHGPAARHHAAASFLGAAYEGAVFTLLRALRELPGAAAAATGRCAWSAAAPGAVRGWRPCGGCPAAGRPPRSTELVALGAAALAAGAATGGDPVAIATAWGAGGGETLPPVRRDHAASARIAAVLDRAAPALLTPQGHR